MNTKTTIPDVEKEIKTQHLNDEENKYPVQLYKE